MTLQSPFPDVRSAKLLKMRNAPHLNFVQFKQMLLAQALSGTHQMDIFDWIQLKCYVAYVIINE